MKHLALLLLLTSTTLAHAETQKHQVVVKEDKFTWTITVDNCNIDKTIPVKILTKKRSFPSENVTISQGQKKMRCAVEQIEVVTT